MNVEEEVAKQAHDDRMWKEGRRRWMNFGTKVALAILGVGLLFSTLGAWIVGATKADNLKPHACYDSFGYHTTGTGYTSATCDHPAHVMTVEEYQKPTADKNGYMLVRCTCNPGRAALLTCDPELPERIRALWPKTVNSPAEPVDAVTP
jgi:hypothetical protein